MQFVCPVSFMNVVGGHSSHCVSVSKSWSTEPRAHSVQLSWEGAPLMGWKVPTSHEEQFSEPRTLWYRPGSQDSQEVLLSLSPSYLPAEHGTHRDGSAAPRASWLVPAGQVQHLHEPGPA